MTLFLSECCNTLQLMRLIPPLLFFVIVLCKPVQAGGAACVMAKFEGTSLDYALVVGTAHPVEAQERAEAELRAKGYGDYKKHLDVMRAQNLSDLERAYVVVVRSEFKDIRGRDRSAMGCGFSSSSYPHAEFDAVRDLQAYFWGWKPDQHGYEIVRQLRY